MNRGLIRKELRELRPFVALVAFLLVLDLVYWLTQQLDMQPLAITFEELGQEMAAVMFFIAFALGTGLLVREVDDHTLAFLDGLPVARRRIFGIKTAVAATVLLVYPVGYLLLLVTQHLVSRESLDYTMHPALLWQAFAMICVVTAMGLALGLLLGFLRSLSWLVLAVSAFVLYALSRFWPDVAVLNPLELLDIQLTGARWPVPWTALVMQLVVLTVSLLLALRLFVGAGAGARSGKMQSRLNRPLVSAMVTLATVGVGIAVLALYGRSVSEAEPAPDALADSIGASFQPSAAGNAQTMHYLFSYPAQQSAELQVLLSEADGIHAQVAGLLDTTSGPRIDVDLSGSAANTAGTAFHERIRMRQGGNALAVLAHETAHVLALRLAGGERERELSKMTVLNEGLATWIENQVTVGTGLTDAERLQAAIVSRRQLLRPEQLADFEYLERNVDLNLQYPLGAALVDALVGRHGRDAPVQLLRTLGNPDFPRNLAGAELWFAAFQAAGFDLAQVFADYARRLKSWEAEFADQIAALPRPRGSLVRDGSRVGVELRLDAAPQDWTAVVRFRPKEGSDLRDYVGRSADADLVAWMPAHWYVNARACFQPGLRNGEVVIFEAWTCLPLESAAQW